MTLNNGPIIFILPLFSGGGAERVLINIINGLHNNGHSVGIIVFKRDGPLLSLILSEIPIYDLETKSLKNSIFALLRKIWQLRPKVIISTFGYINIFLLSVRWILPRKVKIWVREANLPSGSLLNNKHSKLMDLLYHFFYKKANKVISTSKKMKHEFISDFSVPENSIELLPNPLDYEKIRQLASPLKRFDNGGVCFVASGRLTFQKGFDRLLLWFSNLDDNKSTLIILGDGELRQNLINRTKAFNIQERVRFLGFCENPWQWYAGADVFLLSSRWEGMPNAALEALACGTKVIATRESGGVGEITKELNDTIIVLDENHEFINCMNKVIPTNKKFISRSLLPNKYKSNNIINTIEGWLNESK